MTTLYAYDQTDLLSLNLYFWYQSHYFTEEFNDDAKQDGFDDNYTLYTDTNDALSLYGYDFGRDLAGDMVYGTIEALSQWAWAPDPTDLVNGGEWVERWHWDGWNQRMDVFWNVANVTPGTADDLALIKGVMSGADTLFLSGLNDAMSGFKGADLIFGFAGNDILNGNKGADVLRGGTGNDELNGNRGHDILNGGRGMDDLNGGEGNDVLGGQSGQDVLRGGAGRDVSQGGGGADRFVFKTGDEKDIILDFQLGIDVVDLRGLQSVNNWDDLVNNHMVQNGPDVVIDGLNGDKVVLRDTNVFLLDENDFLI